MAVITTLGFAGETENALNFYAQVLDAEILFLMRFRECPDPSWVKPGMEDLIFHATFRIDGTELMASDVGHDDQSVRGFSGFALLLRAKSEQKAERILELLADGGRIQIPFAKSAFTSGYGMVTDRFGVTWKVNVD